MFLRDDKKKNYYLLTVRDALAVDLKQFQEKIGSRRLSFASEEDLMRFLALKKGAVTPFGVLNDIECAVQVYIDAYFENKTISVHPNENNATVYLAANDLVELLRVHGNKVEYIELG
jgi:Ala-tRNA(Pro) deacylase